MIRCPSRRNAAFFCLAGTKFLSVLFNEYENNFKRLSFRHTGSGGIFFDCGFRLHCNYTKGGLREL